MWPRAVVSVLAPRWDAWIYNCVIPGPARCFVPGLGSRGPLGRKGGRGVRVGGWRCVLMGRMWLGRDGLASVALAAIVIPIPGLLE